MLPHSFCGQKAVFLGLSIDWCALLNLNFCNILFDVRQGKRFKTIHTWTKQKKQKHNVAFVFLFGYN